MRDRPPQRRTALDMPSTRTESAATRDEAALIDGLAAGNEAAFRQAVRQYSGAMLATARAIVGRDAAEDIVQDVWLSAFRSIGQFERRSSLKTWLCRACANRAITWLRSARRHPVDSLDDLRTPDLFDSAGRWIDPPATQDIATPEAVLESRGLRDCIESLIGTLPDHQRAALVMRDVHGIELDSIGTELATSPGNVRVLLHRARARLARMISHYHQTGDC